MLLSMVPLLLFGQGNKNPDSFHLPVHEAIFSPYWPPKRMSAPGPSLMNCSHILAICSPLLRYLPLFDLLTFALFIVEWAVILQFGFITFILWYENCILMGRALILKPLLKMVMKMIQMENPAVMKNLRGIVAPLCKTALRKNATIY